MGRGGNPIELDDILSEIDVPEIEVAPDVLSNARQAVSKDLFAEQKRKAWKEGQADEARCDFTRKVRITRRSDTFFISLWQKSLMGRTLTDIKGDESMVAFFAENMAPLMADIRGDTVAVVTSQNLTRGNRHESAFITTDKAIFDTLHSQVNDLIRNHSVPLNELFQQRINS